MSPIDDELRTMLMARTDRLVPAADPLAGIELRARGMRRRRVAAAIAGTALAVSVVAVGAPALLSDRRTTGGVTPARSGPPTQPAPSASSSTAAVLDPQHPWPYRGDSGAAVVASFDALRADWASRHPGSRLTPLYGHIDEPSQRPEIVFVAHAADEDRWGVATTTGTGFAYLHDALLPPDSKALLAALSGDEAPRLIVLAAPATGDIGYASDGTTFAALPMPAPGVAFRALEGDTSHDAVRVLDGNGDLDAPVFLGPAPDAAPAPGADYRPGNYLAWQTRGVVDARLELQAVAAYAKARGARDALVGHHVLWGGTDRAGRGLLLMEAWVGGGQAQTFGLVSTGEPFLGPVLGQNPPLLAYLAAGAPGTGADVLVLLPRPGAGPFSYAPSAGTAFQSVGNARSDLANVAVIDRNPRGGNDQVEVLDGDGMHVLYRGAVQPLLCGASGCG